MNDRTKQARDREDGEEKRKAEKKSPKRPESSKAKNRCNHPPTPDSSLKMRRNTSFSRIRILAFAFHHVTDAFIAPSASAVQSLVGYSTCASSVGYSPENNIIDWGRQTPQQYYGAQDERWENPMAFDERTGNRPSWSPQDEFPPNSNSRDMMNFEQFSVTHNYKEGPTQMNLGFEGEPNPSFGQWAYQQEYSSDDLGQNGVRDYERQGPFRPNNREGRRTYRWNEPRISLDRQDNDSFSEQTQRRSYDYDYQNYNDQRYYEYEQSRRLPREAMRQVEREQYRWPNDMGFVNDERTARGMMMMSPLRGFEVLDRMLDDMLDGLGLINDVMDRLSFGMETRMGQDFMLSTDNLLDDAYADLVADPAVSEMMGDSIRLGIPTAQSSSSYIINGIRRSRVEMVVPVEGSRSMGQMRLLADEAGILRLELGIGGRVINVQGGGRRSYNAQRDIGNEGVIDATIVE